MGLGSIMGGGGGGKGGGGGGLSPQQAALAEYTRGQQMLKARATFGKSGLGASTMATEAAGGANYAGAASAAASSDLNTQIANQQSGDLGSLAGQLAAFGSQNTTGGSTSSNTSDTITV